jgi:NDP-sugar pyrophosphorylase family protein
MKAVLLAAGLGTRLAPLTDSIPKILVPFRGKPLLEHQLVFLARSEVDEVAINLHHHADQVRRFLVDHEPPLAVRTSFESELLGTAGALIPFRDFLTEPFIVLYGDVVTDTSVSALLERQLATSGVATLTFHLSDRTEGKGLLTLESDGRVTSFREKPGESRGTGMVNAGIYAMSPEIFEFIEEGADFGHDVLPAVLEAGKSLYGYRAGGFVYDIGSLEALRAAERALASEEAPAW